MPVPIPGGRRPSTAPPAPTDLTPISGLMTLPLPKAVPAQSGGAQRAAAVQRMKDIHDRASQKATKRMDFERRVEEEKRRRRGGERGDVVALGKRKSPEPEMPRSILRRPATAEEPRSRQRLYGPRTQVFNMDQPIAVR